MLAASHLHNVIVASEDYTPDAIDQNHTTLELLTELLKNS